MTTLQIPDSLAKQISEIAEAIGVPIPELLVRMLADYQRRFRRVSQKRTAITARLDIIYALQSSTLDSALLKMQRRSLGREPW
jgi:hypothetical protein